MTDIFRFNRGKITAVAKGGALPRLGGIAIPIEDNDLTTKAWVKKEIQTGDFVPISGTESGVPITGIIESSSSIKIDTIDEYTGNAGVTIDEMLIKDGGLTLSGNLIANTKNISTDTSTGTKIGTAVGQKLGFWNVTPVIQPKAAGQVDQGAMTSSVIGDTGSTNGGWGASSEVNADKIFTAVDQLVSDVAALDVLLTEMRTALVNTGIMKGAA